MLFRLLPVILAGEERSDLMRGTGEEMDMGGIVTELAANRGALLRATKGVE